MDQGAINKIIMDSTVVDSGCRCNEIEKEFMLLKGSIKKLIIDIREQMNNSENPFNNIQLLQMSPPAPVIKEDPIEFELPTANEEKPKEDKSKTLANEEKKMAQDKKTGNCNECPLAAKETSYHDHCPLMANNNKNNNNYNNNRQGQRCPATGANLLPANSCQAANHYNDNINLGDRQRNPCGYQAQAPRREENATCAGSQGCFDTRNTCTTCGRPLSPTPDGYAENRPAPYATYHPRTWHERSDNGMHQGISRQAAFARRPLRYESQGYAPVDPGEYYDHPSENSCDSYPPRRPSRQHQVPPRYSPRYDDGYDNDLCDEECQQPYNRGLEPAHYPPMPEGRRDYVTSGDPRYSYNERPVERRQFSEPYLSRPLSRRGPEYPEVPQEFSYRRADERVEGDWYGPAENRAQPQPRRRRGHYAQPTERDSYDEYEVTEPRQEIEYLTDMPEPEIPCTRKKSRRMIGIVEMPESELVDMPNPKPRRSRSAKPRG